MDRLKDLRKGAQAAEPVVIDIGSKHQTLEDEMMENPMMKGKGAQQGEYMQKFFKDVEDIKSDILLIKEATHRLEEINGGVMTSTQDFSQETGTLVSTTNNKIILLKTKLENLKNETDALKAGGKRQSEAEIRIRDNLGNTLTRKFVEVSKTYQAVQTTYKVTIKRKAKRQIGIAVGNQNVTDEDIDNIIRSGATGEIIQSSILSGPAHDDILKAYKDVENKYQDVLKLEESINELNQLFLDFAVLVQLQGEMLEIIENNVKAASDYIDQGNDELTSAISYKISSRKMQCYCCIFCLIIIGIIIGVVYYFVQKNKAPAPPGPSPTPSPVPLRI